MTMASTTVPEVTPPRYAAPRVVTEPVEAVISSEPIPGQRRPGHYQHVLLNTRTGRLLFHESTEHLEPWDPAWRSLSDVPRARWRRWHPGSPFVSNGPHCWFEPVPEELTWTVDSGVDELPFLGVAEANALLAEVVPYGQALLDQLFDVGGDLDWSADAGRAGRAINGLVSRHRKAAEAPADGSLVDYADIVSRFPQTYQPGILGPAANFAEQCESITRFLGCNPQWHQEIKKVFGVPYRDGTGVDLQVIGVRAWYRALMSADDPRPLCTFADWAAETKPLSDGTITSLSSDAELDSWAQDQEQRAADQGLRLVGARDAAITHRQALRDQDWDRLAVVGARLEQLRALAAERTALIASFIGLGREDSEIASQGRVSRQAVNSMRQRLEAEAGGEDDAEQ